MAFDWGYVIGGVVILYIVSLSYKKKTGKPLSELWKNNTEKLQELKPEFQRVYINKGVKY